MSDVTNIDRINGKGKEPLLIEHRTLLQTDGGVYEGVTLHDRSYEFVEFVDVDPDEEAVHRHLVQLDALTWRDMGEPRLVTVTIAPGDELS